MVAQDIIIRPIITEKSMNGNAMKMYTFEVAKNANKIANSDIQAQSKKYPPPPECTSHCTIDSPIAYKIKHIAKEYPHTGDIFTFSNLSSNLKNAFLSFN